MKNIRIGYFPGKVVMLAVEDTDTVGDAIRKAGLSLDTGMVVKRQGEDCRLDDTLDNEDNVFIMRRKIEGNKKNLKK